MHTFSIKDRMIGDGCPAYIIAEMSANHAGSLDNAKEIIRAAKECGADCIKIQTYTPDTLTIDCHNEYFQVQNGTWEGENLYSLYGKAYTPWEWHAELKAEADSIGIDFFSTPFDRTSVDFLEELGVEFYKIASFEMVDIPLLQYVASKGKPIIMSTGMGTLAEIKEAVEAIRETGNTRLALLKCSSAYPAKYEEMNLRTMADIKEKMQVPVGLSDHSMGHLSAVTAVALGANIIEKHFCLSRDIENPDASFSMNPAEFKAMVEEVRNVESAMGKVCYGVSKQEESSVIFRRSVFAVQDIKEGDRFTGENLRVIRPGYGEKPKYLKDILGMTAGCEIKRGVPFTFDSVKKGCILFLSNNENSRELLLWLQEAVEDTEVYSFTSRITSQVIRQLEPEMIISYNYRHIVPEEVLILMKGKVINLHTSLLPYNRGSSPNFFSFMENTPKGVSIHQMAKGLDTGDILCQTEIPMNENEESFASSYEKLQRGMIRLFQEKWEDIRQGRLTPVPQKGTGSYHVMKEVEEFREKHPFQWTDNIAEMKRKYNLR